MKRCPKCEVSKPFTDFARERGRKDGYYPWCRSCKKATDVVSHLKHAAVRRAKMKAYREADPAGKTQRDRVYHAANRSKRLAQMATWLAKNMDVHNAGEAKRHAQKLKATPAWAEDEYEQLVIVEMYDLARRKTELTGIIWHVDHIVPLQSKRVCGLHCMANLRVITKAENCSKQNRFWPDMWPVECTPVIGYDDVRH